MLVAAAAAGAGGKAEVPVDGALAASDTTPSAGEQVRLYLSVTALEAVRTLALGLTLPADVQPVDDAPTTARFDDVAAGRTVVLAVPVVVGSAEPRRIVGAATVADAPALKVERAFVLELNGAPACPPAAQEGRDSRGNRLRIFDGH